MYRKQFAHEGDSESLWTATRCPGWSDQELIILKIGLMKFGIGRWKKILSTKSLTKTPLQCYTQTQRLLGRQGIAEFMALHIDIDRVREDARKEDAFKKCGIIINKSGRISKEELAMRWRRNKEKYGLDKAFVKSLRMPQPLDVMSVNLEHIINPNKTMSAYQKIEELIKIEDELKKRLMALADTQLYRLKPLRMPNYNHFLYEHYPERFRCSNINGDGTGDGEEKTGSGVDEEDEEGKVMTHVSSQEGGGSNGEEEGEQESADPKTIYKHINNKLVPGTVEDPTLVCKIFKVREYQENPELREDMLRRITEFESQSTMFSQRCRGGKLTDLQKSIRNRKMFFPKKAQDGKMVQQAQLMPGLGLKVKDTAELEEEMEAYLAKKRKKIKVPKKPGMYAGSDDENCDWENWEPDATVERRTTRAMARRG